jgi:hypothetical protein
MSYGDSGVMVVDHGSRSVRSWLVRDWDDLVRSIDSAAAPVVSAHTNHCRLPVQSTSALPYKSLLLSRTKHCQSPVRAIWLSRCSAAQTVDAVAACESRDDAMVSWCCGEDAASLPDARRAISRGVVKEWEHVSALWCATPVLDRSLHPLGCSCCCRACGLRRSLTH